MGDPKELAYTSFEDLTKKQDVYDLVKSEIAAANDRLAPVEQIKAFRLLPKELHQDDGEMTATQKIRRRAVSDKFSALIETMYGGPSGDFIQYIVSGVALGSIYAVVALGFVVIYRASKVFNFAHGEFLTFGALMMATLESDPIPPEMIGQLGAPVISGFGLPWGYPFSLQLF